MAERLDTAIATNYEADIVKLVNSKKRHVDRMFCWGIIPFCETSHEGIKKVYYKMGYAFQLFEVDEDAKYCHTLPLCNK